MEQYPGRLPSTVRRYDRGVASLPDTSSRLPVPRRASARQNSTDTVVQVEEKPFLTRQRQHRHWHPLTLAGIVLLLLVTGWWLLIQVASWWQVTQNDWHYGRPRTFQTDEVVGHHDSPAQPSHFIVLNLHGHILIYELPGGDAARTQIYLGPVLLGQGQDLTPVTLKFQDVNGDGKVDMLLLIADSSLIYINTGSAFKAQNL